MDVAGIAEAVDHHQRRVVEHRDVRRLHENDLLTLVAGLGQKLLRLFLVHVGQRLRADVGLVRRAADEIGRTDLVERRIADAAIDQVSRQIYQELRDLGLEVLLDDRALRAGVKFKDADLIGIPVRITIGKRSVTQGNVELKLRREAEGQTVSITEAAHQALELVEALRAELRAQGD